ncbi:MAG: ABC transporter permease [Planctomycetota bacterium]
MRFTMLIENAKLAIDTLKSQKTRSLLTILGVFIGSAIIVCVASVLNGFRQSVIDQVEEFGTNNIYIYRYPFVRTGHLAPEVRNRKPLQMEDALAIGEQCPAVETVIAGVQARNANLTARYRGEEMQGPGLRGSFPEAERIGNLTLEEGRFFTDSENRHRSAVCVIAHNVVQALFPNTSALGKHIRVGGTRFQVVGVIQKLKEGPFGSANQEDNNIHVPYYTFRKIYPEQDDHFISARAYTGKLDTAIDQIEEVLRRRRKVKWTEENNFEIGTADSIIASFDQIVFGVLAVMFLLSTVAFLVGGVGVMNIMLVSVKERTREIGLRKALGAKRKDITWQFLVEAMILTGIGGLFGVLVGEGLMMAVSSLVEGLPSATPTWARVFGFGGSASVGLIFGIWPALQAARLDPIEALRYE